MNWLWIIVGLIFIAGLWLYYQGSNSGNPLTAAQEQHYRRQGWTLLGIAAIGAVVLLLYPTEFSTENPKAQMPGASPVQKLLDKGWTTRGRYLISPEKHKWSWAAEWTEVEHNGLSYFMPLHAMFDLKDN